MIKYYYSKLDILNYLERCCSEMTKEEITAEVAKLKNVVEEENITMLRRILGS